MNFRISGQRIKVKTCAKYLGIIIDEFLNWKSHFDVLRTKLGRSIGLLSKIRYFVSANLLTTIYFAIFDSYLCYGCQVWGQNKNASTKEIASIQDKALRIMSFNREHLNRDIPSAFSGCFTYMANIHNHNTRGALKN